MRNVIGVVLVIAAAPTAAQVPAAAIAPGETALHIVAHGETETRADRIELPVTVSGRGPTAAAARSEAEANAAKLVTALVAAGIDRAAITRLPAAARATPFIPPVIVAPSVQGGPVTPRTPVVTQTASIRLVLPNGGALERARQVVAGQEQAQTGTAIPSLVDDASARRAAAKDALGHARREADDYAAPLGLRVIRVVAVSNAAGIGDGLDVLAQQFRDLGDRNKPTDTVVTRATAAVDYALAPGR